MDGPESPLDDNTADTSKYEEIVPKAFYEYQIFPQETDPQIIASTDPHYVYLDTRVQSRGKLLIFLSGTDSPPAHYQIFTRIAAELGYHVVNVTYLNGVGVTKCSGQSDEECFRNFHEEIIFGKPGSEFVKVDSINSIYNRTLKLLLYLDREHPQEGWNNFFDSNKLVYNKLVLAGHSQGGGHAAYFAYKFAIDRVIMFAAPNDYSSKYKRSANWCRSKFATSEDRFYGLIHQRDEIVSSAEQYIIWHDMKMLSTSDTASADGSNFSGHRALYTNFNPNPEAMHRLKHNVPAKDETMPTGANGEHLRSVWRHLLEN